MKYIKMFIVTLIGLSIGTLIAYYGIGLSLDHCITMYVGLVAGSLSYAINIYTVRNKEDAK